MGKGGKKDKEEEQATRDNFSSSIEAAFYQQRWAPTDRRVTDEKRSQKKTGHDISRSQDRQTAATANITAI